MTAQMHESCASAALATFLERHWPVLDADHARYNILVWLIERCLEGAMSVPFLWSGKAPGACAMQMPGRPLTMTNLDRDDCRRLADLYAVRDYPAVGGTEETAAQFVERALDNGHRFAEPMPQAIHSLRHPPRYPGAAGRARLAVSEDVAFLYDWALGFHREAVPHEPLPDIEHLKARIAGGRYWIWEVGSEPVALAAWVRETRQAGGIAFVYTRPDRRGRGYGGSAVAAVAEAIFAAGKSSACLYTDLRNPFSNRCYARIGFERIASAAHFPRLS